MSYEKGWADAAMDEDLHVQLADMAIRHWWYQGRRAVLQSVLERAISGSAGFADREILEVGAGSGAVTSILRHFGSVTACEPDATARSFLAERHPDVTVLGADVSHLDGLGTFDLVAAFDVIEHLDDDIGAVRILRQHTTPRGTVALSVPALELLWGPHDTVNDHRRRYTRAQLARTMERAGLEVERVTYFNTLLFPIVALTRIARRALRADSTTATSDFEMPPDLVNRALAALFSFEGRLLQSIDLPVGVSLVAVARVPL